MGGGGGGAGGVRGREWEVIFVNFCLLSLRTKPFQIGM